MPREVITLQFGNFANYVGAHYWNFQDELLGLQAQQDGRGTAAQVDSDVLFRQGETLSGEGTYTPRLVLYDLSGALGGVSAGGALYRDADRGSTGRAVVSTWAGRQEVYRAAPVAKSRFAAELEAEAEELQEEGGEEGQEPEHPAAAEPSALEQAAQQLDSRGGSSGDGGGVRYWTDFLKARLHPRSVHQLAGAWHGLTPFDGWGDGGEVWRSSEEQREAMMERIRFFSEECDRLQGLQCLVDDLSGFGQLAAHVLQEVRDEYGCSVPAMVFALRPDAAATTPAAAAAGAEAGEAAGGDVARWRRRQLNDGLSLALLSPLCSTFTAVAPPAAQAALPLLRWQPGNWYHASALCAAALDTATLPYRLAGGEGPGAALGRTDSWGLAHLLTAQHSSPLTALSMALPCAPLPADLPRQAQQADARLQQGGSSRGGTAGASGSGSAGGSPFTTQWLASLTPGIAAAGDAARFAEVVALRGPRSAAGSPVELGTAAQALDAALASERLRCVRQRVLAAQPLAVPLPFPHIFAEGLSQTGDAPPAGRLGSGSRDIASCPVLTRLAGTVAFGGLVAAQRQQFCAVAGSGAGQATLESWGHGREEVAELQERLSQLAHAYDEA